MNSNLDVNDRIELAKHKDRPKVKEIIPLIFEDFTELHGDRYFGDDTAVIGGVGFFDDIPVTVIGHVKGKTVTENIRCNFGMPQPEGYRKALRLMKQAEKFNRPIICFVDTPGAFCGVGAEERGQGEAIAKNLLEMSSLQVPVITVVTGEGGSGGALALAVANRVLMLENAVYSIISPRGFASILWKDASREKEAARVMKITSFDLLELGVIDEIIEEPDGGGHLNINIYAANIKEAVKKCLTGLLKLNGKETAQDRYDKFRKIGVFADDNK